MLQALLPLMDEQAVGIRCILLEVFLEPFLEPFLELTLAIFLLSNIKPQTLSNKYVFIASIFKCIIHGIFFR